MKRRSSVRTSRVGTRARRTTGWPRRRNRRVPVQIAEPRLIAHLETGPRGLALVPARHRRRGVDNAQVLCRQHMLQGHGDQVSERLQGRDASTNPARRRQLFELEPFAAVAASRSVLGYPSLPRHHRPTPTRNTGIPHSLARSSPPAQSACSEKDELLPCTFISP